MSGAQEDHAVARADTRSIGKVTLPALGVRPLVATALVATMACGGPRPADTPDATATGSTGASGSDRSRDSARPVITIKDFAFITPSSVAPGEKVVLRNDDDVTHTFTAHGDGGFDITLQASQSVTFVTPHAKGRYDLLCTLHPSMSGTLTVR